MGFNAKTILVPVSFETERDILIAEQTMAGALDVARRFDARLVLACAQRSVALTSASARDYAGEIDRGRASLLEARLEESREKLEVMAERARKEGLNASAVVLKDFVKVADAIVQLAQDEGADLIVLSPRTRKGMRRWLLGNIAKQVSARSAVNVLLLKTPLPEDSDRDI